MARGRREYVDVTSLFAPLSGRLTCDVTDGRSRVPIHPQLRLLKGPQLEPIQLMEDVQAVHCSPFIINNNNTAG